MKKTAFTTRLISFALRREGAVLKGLLMAGVTGVLLACGGNNPAITPSGVVVLSPAASQAHPLQIAAASSTGLTASESGYKGSFSVSGGVANCFMAGMLVDLPPGETNQIQISPASHQQPPCSGSFVVSDALGHSTKGYVRVH